MLVYSHNASPLVAGLRSSGPSCRCLYILTISHLLWRDREVLDPHVDDLVDVDAGDDEEHAGPPGAPSQDPAQAEDDGLLVFLDHHHHHHVEEDMHEPGRL